MLTEEARLYFSLSLYLLISFIFQLLFPTYFQFTGPLLLNVVKETFVFASVDSLQRKSVLQLAIRASCSSHVLVPKNFDEQD